MNGAFYAVNSISTILFSIILLIFLPFTLIFYLKRFTSWGNENFDNRYGALFKGLRKDRKSSLIYPMMFIIRRFAFAMISIFATDYLFVQLIVI